jgi:hypothetical protein
MASSLTYVIRTNLPPEAVNEIGLIIFAHWLDFAMGHTVLNGRRLMYPSGKYAASLSYRREGESTVAIVADEGQAPEAGILEQGHGPIDLKTRLQRGRAYPMHRFSMGGMFGLESTGLRRVGSGPPSMKPSMWAEIRMREASGFASIGPNSPADSWIIPPMPAYSPALILAAQAKQMAGG